MRMKCVRHRCQPAPPNTAAMAALRPSWASLTTRHVPDSPRATRPRRNAVQPAPSSVVMTSTPSTSRCPSALTPVAMTVASDTTRAPWGEHQPHQVVGAEEQVGEPGGVGGVLGDVELAAALAQGEDLVEREQALPGSGPDHLGPEGGVTAPPRQSSMHRAATNGFGRSRVGCHPRVTGIRLRLPGLGGAGEPRRPARGWEDPDLGVSRFGV
jgi:hypothetical protein